MNVQDWVAGSPVQTMGCAGWLTSPELGLLSSQEALPRMPLRTALL